MGIPPWDVVAKLRSTVRSQVCLEAGRSSCNPAHLAAMVNKFSFGQELQEAYFPRAAVNICWRNCEICKNCCGWLDGQQQAAQQQQPAVQLLDSVGHQTVMYYHV
jgi:hypothetical protein